MENLRGALVRVAQGSRRDTAPGVAKSTFSSILNMLGRRKLVRRRAHERERRLVLVDLTSAGAELISALSPKTRAEEARIVAHLSSVQREGHRRYRSRDPCHDRAA